MIQFDKEIEDSEIRVIGGDQVPAVVPEESRYPRPLRRGCLWIAGIADIPIRMYIPHHAEMSLHLGRINRQDTTIVYVAQAADVRADNGGIVGAFVLCGEPKAWGLSKKGFCASIDGKVTVGVAANSPLFEQATERGGYFFRQYPLVDNGVPVFNGFSRFFFLNIQNHSVGEFAKNRMLIGLLL